MRESESLVKLLPFIFIYLNLTESFIEGREWEREREEEKRKKKRHRD